MIVLPSTYIGFLFARCCCMDIIGRLSLLLLRMAISHYVLLVGGYWRNDHGICILGGTVIALRRFRFPSFVGGISYPLRVYFSISYFFILFLSPIFSSPFFLKVFYFFSPLFFFFSEFCTKLLDGETIHFTRQVISLF